MSSCYCLVVVYVVLDEYEAKKDPPQRVHSHWSPRETRSMSDKLPLHQLLPLDNVFTTRHHLSLLSQGVCRWSVPDMISACVACNIRVGMCQM